MKALTAASAEIDGYLAGRYKLPLTSVPPTLNDLCCILTLWRLHTFDPAQKHKDDYDAAQKKLREISAGVFRLPIAGIEPPTTAGSGARVTDRERPFTEATMKGYI